MQSVLRSLRVLEMISERQPVGVNELARLCSLPPSTTQRILLTLADAGWIRSTNERLARWELTFKALVIGRRAAGETTLREAAIGPMTALRDRTHETVNLALLDGDLHTVLIERIDSDQAVRTYSELGSGGSLHATANGRAILAGLDDAVVEKLIAGGLERFTDQTITDPEALRAEVRRVRRVGYAINRGENRANVSSIGAAILDATGSPMAGVSISMPDSRWDRRRAGEWGEQVIATATAIEKALASSV